MGSRFTWHGPQFNGGGRIFESLDRALSNDIWRVAFPDAFVQTLPRVDFLDHHALLIHPLGCPREKVERPFCFESAWCTHPTFGAELHSWWQTGNGLLDKLRCVKKELKDWRVHTFGHVNKKKKDHLARIEGIQKKHHQGRMNRFLADLETSLQKELRDVLYHEELMWHQRSRTKWLLDGDRNTRYYHVKATKRHHRNRIHMLRNDDGDWVEDEVQLKGMVTLFFKSLFTEENGRRSWGPMCYGFRVLEAENKEELGRQVDSDEIKKALF